MVASILEILKYILPSLVVFGTVYYLQKQYNANQYQLKAMELKAQYSKGAIPLKLQAYERLLLFCDRISFHNLILRLKTENMTAKQLKSAMIIAIQKEYEHNLAQQLYTSGKLWEIISTAKNNIIAKLIETGTGQNMDLDSADSYAQSLLRDNKNNSSDMLSLAITAIKEEAKIILDV